MNAPVGGDAAATKSRSAPESAPPRKAKPAAWLGRLIGAIFTIPRDAIAAWFVAIGVTPNMLTILGFLATCAAAACFFLGGGHRHAELRGLGQPPYLLLAGACLILASAFDMLDGAVARIGRLSTPLGAVLDSSVDRLSDVVVYIGLMGHFAVRGNLTYAVLAAVAMGSAMMISYVKARSENLIPDCEVGYWVRGERSAALLIGAFAGTMPAVLWQQSISAGLTVLRRLVWTYQVLAAQAAGRPPPPKTPSGAWGLLRPWRYPRGSWPSIIATAANILFIIFAARISPLFGGGVDPLARLAAFVSGAR